MHTLVIVLQALTAVGLIILMAIQTDKAEQGGVMGLGAAGGRSAGEVDVAVGPERILKPLTKWIAGGFLASSILAAIDPARISVFHVLIGGVLFVLAMMYGATAWQTLTGMRRTS